MTYSDSVEKTASEKVLLAHVEPSQKLVTWSLDSGAIYVRDVSYFVIDLQNNGTSLTEASSAALSSGEFYNDRENGKLYVRLSDDSNPQSAAAFMVATYRLFFSDSPYVLPHDLTDSGELVEYLPSIDSASNFPQEIDNAEQVGIALESNGSLKLLNSDGYFDEIYDKLFFENKRVAIYSWIANRPATENRQMFEGVIESKAFSSDSVSFRVKDQIFKLREPITQSVFSDSDGVISDDVRGKPKRTLYGQVDGLKAIGTDSVLNGFTLTGTLSFSAGSTAVTGSGTLFLKELGKDDEIFVEAFNQEFRFSIDSVTSDTAAVLSDEPEFGFSATVFKVRPKNGQYRFKNRVWHVAGHKLREPTTTITEFIQLNRFKADTTDFFENDTIKVGSESASIKRITQSQNLFVLNQNLDAAVSVGTTVTKNPIRNVYFNGRKFLIDRDFTVTNASSGCYLTFDALAEFNITPIRSLRATSITFTNGSRDVSGVDVNFLDELSKNDWIISDDITHQVFYEVLEIVDETNLKIRVAYAGANNTGNAKKKNVDYLQDTSTVLVDCIGKQDASEKWVKTASDVVLDLLTDAGFSNLDSASFAQAVIEADHTVSLKLPLEPGADAPILRDVVGLVNKSVFGALYVKSDWSLAYSVLSAERPQDLAELKDDDIRSWSVTTKSEIYRRVFGKYRHFDADIYTGEPGNASYEYVNSFVDRLIGTKDNLIEDIYLYDTRSAETLVQRYALIYSLTQSIVRVKAKLNLTLKNINDKLFLSLDRLYKRFGMPGTQKKIGVISKISRRGDSTEVDFSDLGNIFNRVATITPDTASDFTAASDAAKMLNGYIVDNDTELPDSLATTDDEYNTNLIG